MVTPVPIHQDGVVSRAALRPGQKRQLSIKWKIFGYLLGFCLLLLALLWVLQTVMLEPFYRQVRLKSMEKKALELATIIHASEIPELWNPREIRAIQQLEVLEVLYNQVADQGDMQVELWSSNIGSIVFTGYDWEGRSTTNTFGGTGSQYTPTQKRGFQADVEQKGGPVYHFIENAAYFGAQTREYALCVMSIPGDTEDILLLVSSNLTPVGAAVSTLRIQLAVISGIMLLLAVVIAFLIARHVSRPIERLNGSAKVLAKGDYDVHFQSRGYREIAELSQTLQTAAVELGKTDRLRRELIANVSHDLRTPLTLITGYAELVRDLPRENTPENMQVIIEESKRLTSLVTDLLDLSRLETDAAEWEMRPFDLTDDIRTVIDRFSKFCAEEGYTIQFEHTHSVTVTGNPERILQVVYNYITNAITHTGDDKQVRVAQILSPERVTITVTDTGPGIPPQDAPYIWDRYYKGSESHKRSRVGSGLGLSIVKSILTRHPNVQYGAFNHPGGGSTFWFSLPLP